MYHSIQNSNEDVLLINEKQFCPASAFQTIFFDDDTDGVMNNIEPRRIMTGDLFSTQRNDPRSIFCGVIILLYTVFNSRHNGFVTQTVCVTFGLCFTKPNRCNLCNVYNQSKLCNHTRSKTFHTLIPRFLSRNTYSRTIIRASAVCYGEKCNTIFFILQS